MIFQNLGIFVFSHAGATLGMRLKDELVSRLEEGREISLLGPEQMLVRNVDLTGITRYDSLPAALRPFWQPGGALVFIGAAGIAVRAVAPFIHHKSTDIPVLVLDALGKYCISLLSGHWGGGNALTRLVARAVGAIPVITTASEALGGKLALDLLLKDAGVTILDWDELAVAQGHILEGQGIPVWDPMHVLGDHKMLLPVAERSLHPEKGAPAMAIHWKRVPKTAGLVRAAVPMLHIGLGFRKNTTWMDLLAGLDEAMAGLEFKAVKTLATVDVKARDEAMIRLAERLGIAVKAYSPEALAQIATPNPSAHAGKRFGTIPFSVCEAAALLAAADSGRPCLLRAKITVRGSMTFAIALAVKDGHA